MKILEIAASEKHVGNLIISLGVGKAGGTLADLSCSRVFTIAILLFMMFLEIIPLSSAQNGYAPGVKPGDWVKYGDITASWQTSDSSQQKPRDLQNFEDTSWIRLEVESVTGTNITGRIIGSFKNGTQTSQNGTQTFAVNLRDGWGNLTLGAWGSSWACRWACTIAGRLGGTDTLFDVASYGFNDTLTRTYAGASREVNVLSVTFGAGPTKWTYHWDRATGILVEFSVADSWTTQTYSTSGTASMRAVETSLWFPTILGLPLAIFYGTMASLVVVAGVAALIFFRRKRRHPT